jgi:hypothetical protein
MAEFPNFGVNVTNDLATKRVVVRREAYTINQSTIPIYITNATGSFDGVFTGDGSGLTGVVASTSGGIEIASDSSSLGNATVVNFGSDFSTTLSDETASVSVISSSFAQTASFALNAGAGSGFPFSGSAVITGSLLVSGSFLSGSFYGDGANITGVISTSYAETASLAFSIPVYTGSVDEGTISYSGSFTGSHTGDGSQLSGVGILIVSSSAPTTGSYLIENGTLWYDDTTGKTYLYYISSSVESWVLQSDPTFETDVVVASLQDVTEVGASTNQAMRITNTTQADSLYTGALIVSGGIAVQKTARAELFSGSFEGGGFTGSFKGDGSLLTGVVAAASGGIEIRDSNSIEGNAISLNFGNSLSATVSAGTASISAVPLAGTVTSSTQVDFTQIQNTSGIISSSVQFNSFALPFTGSFTGSFTGELEGNGVNITGIESSSYALSSSHAETSNWGGLIGTPNGIVSSSTQITDYNIFATTGSNVFVGDQTITGSLLVSGSSTLRNIGPAEFTGSVDVSSTITLTSNANFLNGTAFGGSNVSLIGVSNDDKVRIGNQGYELQLMDSLDVKGSISASSFITASAFNGNGSQLTSLDYNNINNVPAGIVSSSSNLYVSWVTESVNYTLEITDSGNVVEMSGSAAQARTITIPENTTVDFEVGTQIRVVRGGSGSVQINSIGGVSITSANSYTYLTDIYSSAILIQKDIDNWYLFGDIASGV